MTMKPQHIQKLKDAGASEAQAEAALTAIEDVNEALEAFLCGVFDEVGSSAKRAKVNNSIESQSFDDGSSQKDEDDDEDDAFDPCDTVLSGNGQGQVVDPYHGIEFSKDRKEVITDIVEQAKTFQIEGREESGRKLRPLNCREITAGEWMSGVPLGSEQSYFLEVYQKLVALPIVCPDCQEPVKRKEGQFLSTWPTLFAFLDHLGRTLEYRCKSCRASFCQACGQKPHPSVGNATPTTSGKAADATKPGSSGAASQRLMHCSLTNSLVLGVGLIHIESKLQDSHRSSAGNEKGDQATSKPEASQNSCASSSSQHYYSDEEGFCDCDECTGYSAPSNPLATSGSGPSKRKAGNVTGIGFAGSSRDDYKWQNERTKKQVARDESIRLDLELLRPYLPDPERSCLLDPQGNTIAADPIEHDHLPTIVSIAQLRRRFLPVASELLQSGSLLDITDRDALFTELLHWFRMFSRHVNLAALVTQPIMRLTRTDFKVKNEKCTERVQTFSATASPRELSHSLVQQTKIMIQGLLRRNVGNEGNKAAKSPSKESQSAKVTSQKSAKATEKEDSKESHEEYEKMLAFCRSIVDNIAALDAALVSIKGQAFVDKMLASFEGHDTVSDIYAGVAEDGSQMGSRPTSQHQQIASYRNWAKTAVFDEADMTIPQGSSGSRIYAHAFAKEIQDSNRTSQNSRRNLIIAKEIASLGPSLPADWDQAIFVRVDSAQLDVLKALIVGPPTSPYKNGIFAFDILLPSAYKSAPPQVKIVTTDGGKVRFGPNLYSNGKVCLSLLGTWDGPGWTSESTLLQVLLSITSMVMGLEEPCINEPGWDSYKGTESSLRYSKNLRRQTVRVAMKQMIENPPHPWESVIKQHFKLKKLAILDQLEEWKREDDGMATVQDGTSVMSKYGGVDRPDTTASFAKNVDVLKSLLKGL
ncbi:unnamed protein product [Sympodiomycopsis kandeliae]